MRYGVDEYIPCQWPKCTLNANHQIVNDLESIMVCRSHREATVINIEMYGKIWIFKKDNDIVVKGPITRPGEQKPRYKGTPQPTTAATVAARPDWQQEAAKRADAAAVPVDPAADLVQPRKRTLGDDAASRILGDMVRRD